MSVTQPSINAPKPRSEALTGPLLVVLGVVIVAGLLFGYDQGVISGALGGIERHFSLSSILIEVVTSWVTLGALEAARCSAAISPTTTGARRRC